jgi:hypothetical protein
MLDARVPEVSTRSPRFAELRGQVPAEIQRAMTSAV